MKNSYKYLILIYFLPLIFITSIFSQNTLSNDKPEYLLGKINRLQWTQFSGMDTGNYSPDKKTIDEIKANMANIEVKPVLFAGTWCSDSEREVPRVFMLLDELKLSDNLDFYAVDRDKAEPGGKAKASNIEKVPTLIIYVDGKEKGRIIETPSVSWEQDFLDIISK